MNKIAFGFASTDGLFDLGAVVGTPESITALQKAGVSARSLLERHITGDWGDIHPDDQGLNEEALAMGGRIFSVYHLPRTRQVIWIITEADRSVTTILTPEDY